MCFITVTSLNNDSGTFAHRAVCKSYNFPPVFIKGIRAAAKKAGHRIASAPCCMLPLCARFCARGNRHRLPKQAAHAHAHHHSVAAAHGRVPLSSSFAQHPAGFDVCSIRPFCRNVNTFPAHLCTKNADLANYTNLPVWQVIDLPKSYKCAMIIVTQYKRETLYEIFDP